MKQELKFSFYFLSSPSRKFAPFYGPRKASFTYTGMFDEDEEDEQREGKSRETSSEKGSRKRLTWFTCRNLNLISNSN